MIGLSLLLPPFGPRPVPPIRGWSSGHIFSFLSWHVGTFESSIISWKVATFDLSNVPTRQPSDVQGSCHGLGRADWIAPAWLRQHLAIAYCLAPPQRHAHHSPRDLHPLEGSPLAFGLKVVG